MRARTAAPARPGKKVTRVGMRYTHDTQSRHSEQCDGATFVRLHASCMNVSLACERRFVLSSNTVRVGIVGVGNCASSFVQGLTYYRDASSSDVIPGLMNPDRKSTRLNSSHVKISY